MAFNLKDIIFSTRFWTKIDVVTDPNKDGAGKGTLQRYHEVIGEDYDLELHPLIEKMVDNNLDPNTALTKFLIYLEQLLLPVNLGSDEDMRRRILKYTSHFNRIKGTRSGYATMFSMLGFTTTIVEDWGSYTWDDPIKDLDDDDRVFDTNCYGCSKYSILLDSVDPVVVDYELLRLVHNVIDYNEPVNAELNKIIFINGVGYVLDNITVLVIPEGDLTYNNQNSPGTTLQVDVNGCIFVDGDNKTNYTLSPEGDLIFTN